MSSAAQSAAQGALILLSYPDPLQYLQTKPLDYAVALEKVHLAEEHGWALARLRCSAEGSC